MLRRLVAFGLCLFVLSCTEGPARCDPDCPTGTVCDTTTNLCVQPTPDAGGNAAGGNAAGGNTGGGNTGGGNTGGGNTGGGNTGGGNTGGGSGGGAAIPAPVFTLVTPSPGVAVFGAMTELVGSLTFSAGREVTSATLELGGGQTLPLSISGTTWRVTIPLPQGVESPSTFTLSVLDASGATTTTMLTVTVDTLGPRTQLTQPSSTTVVGATAMLQGTATDPALPLTVSVDVGAGPLPATVGMGGAWQASVTFPPNLDRVSRTVTVSATDALGNTSTTMAQVLVDTEGPAFALSSPDAGVAVGASATLTGTAADPTGPLANVTIDTGAGPVALQVTDGGTWSHPTTFPANLNRVLRPIVLRAEDALGNVGQATVQVLVDTQGPALALTSPDAGVAVGASATLAGTATDPSGPVSMLTVDFGTGPLATPLSGTTWSRAATFPANLNRVLRTVTLTARDALGNLGQATAQVLVDTQGPTFTLTTPAAGVAVGASTTLTGTASDPTGPVSMLTVDFGTGPISTPLTGSTWSRAATFPPNLNRVQRPVTLSAQDALGNVGQATLQVLVDTQGPTLLASWPAATPRSVFAGGADLRDPTEVTGGPALWRRHDFVPVTVQSPSSDLNASTVEVAVGGNRVLANPGANCATDGGFCRLVWLDLKDPPMPGLRGTFAIEAFGADVLGNGSALDAGTVAVSRWAFSFDGGSPFNGFSMASTGELVVPHAGRSAVSLLRADGALRARWATRYPPVTYAAVGQVPERSLGRFVYVFEQGAAEVSFAEAFLLDSPQAAPVPWVADDTRNAVLNSGPIVHSNALTGEEEVAVLFRSPAGKPAAVWAALVRPAGLAQFGTRFAAAGAPSINAPVLSAAATGAVITATDGTSLFSFGGGSGTFMFLEERGLPYLQTPGSFLEVTNLIGLPSNEVVGLGRLPASNRGFFRATFPGAFAPSAAVFTDWLSAGVTKGGVVFVVATPFTGNARLCRASLGQTPALCTSDATESIRSSLALGEGDTLYDIAVRPPSQQALLQVRSATTLALRWETPLPGTPDQCLGLTPTCVANVPMVGCIDLQGRAIFLATDGRGIDTGAEWPMLGHDPSVTWNQTTDLTPFACP